jgi:hypothetical protein
MFIAAHVHWHRPDNNRAAACMTLGKPANHVFHDLRVNMGSYNSRMSGSLPETVEINHHAFDNQRIRRNDQESLRLARPAYLHKNLLGGNDIPMRRND